MTEPAQRSLRFIDVSGVGNTGKSAAVDLLREIDGAWVPEYWFEFDLIRVPGGLLDLRHALVDDWSPIRSHAAIRRFLSVADKMGQDPKPWDLLGMMRSTSQRYDARFQGSFRKLARDFALSFVVGTYLSEWPYDSLDDSPLERLRRKLLRRAGGRRLLLRPVMLVDGHHFDQRASEFLRQLYDLIVPSTISMIVLNNGFEPFNPGPGLDMLSGARQIVVTRDPRDVYVSGLNAHAVPQIDRKLIAFDNDGLNKSFLATDDLSLFIRRFRLYHEMLPAESDPRVLQLAFEDLALRPSETIPRLFEFLKIDPRTHARPGTTFNPARSAQNVGLWRDFSDQAAIRRISEELTPWLVDG